MAKAGGAVVQGTLDMLVLKTLALEAMHGFGIAGRIEAVSRGVFKVNPGSLFASFRRLEHAGLVKSDWRVTDNNRRAKYYALTARGRKRLEQETADWERQTTAIATILGTA
jgi:PadR family transcriptional regulator, regulatory protein PadR